jgi:hypothetical protein
MFHTDYLKVPGAWLDACGLGTHDRVLPVLLIREFNRLTVQGTVRTHTYVTVDIDGRRWVVDVETRKAEFVFKPCITSQDRHPTELDRQILGERYVRYVRDDAGDLATIRHLASLSRAPEHRAARLATLAGQGLDCLTEVL